MKFNEWRNLSDRELRKEYSRLRSIARKRGERLEKAGLVYLISQNYHFPKVKDISTHQNLAMLARAVETFLENPLTKVKTARIEVSKRVQALHEHGYMFIDEGNYPVFARFMEQLVDVAKVAGYLSEEVVEWFEEHYTEDVKISELHGDFKEWMENGSRSWEVRST